MASIDSFATGVAIVEDGSMHIRFDDPQIAKNVEPGMTVIVGETESRVSGMGADPDGTLFASADTTLANGRYVARVVFRQTQVIELLFN